MLSGDGWGIDARVEREPNILAVRACPPKPPWSQNVRISNRLSPGVFLFCGNRQYVVLIAHGKEGF